jgi:hypothetical protein
VAPLHCSFSRLRFTWIMALRADREMPSPYRNVTDLKNVHLKSVNAATQIARLVMAGTPSYRFKLR